ncbi:non-specific lipid transfer protein GPI-anchored 5-like [Aristolochia californica]|uniref:non-specific lipid transfer protein GPI-anchored 5-like n=1 Tax=Aristolochia californica TaxID=171875 RepID=UPI0035E1484C
MAIRGAEMGFMIVLVATTLWTGARAQSSCTTALVSLSPCLSYVTGNSTTPSASCCTQLTTVVNTQMRCLCMVLNGGASSIGTAFNQTQALTLPGACKIQTPPVSQCNAVGAPVTSPAASPSSTPASPTTPTTPTAASPASPSTPSVPSIPSGTGSKTVPSKGGEASAASSSVLPVPMLFVLLSIASYAPSLPVF